MTTQELIRQIQEQYQEWFEMVDAPKDLLVNILASKLLGLMQYQDYLEKKI